MERITTLLVILACLYLSNVNSAPLWPLIDESYAERIPDALDYSAIFESKLDKVNRYRHLKELLKGAIIELDRYEERILDEIAELERDLPFLRTSKSLPSAHPSSYLQPRTFVPSHHRGGHPNPRPDIIPMRKRDNRLSVDLTLQTLKDMIASEEGREKEKSNLNYSTSRLLRAGRK